jgi:zinc protease
MRPKEPAAVAKKLVTLNDEKVEQPSWQRCYMVPSYRTAAPGEAEALELAAHLLGGGQTSLLYRALVLDEKLALMMGAHYMGSAVDATRLFLYGMPAPGVSMEMLDAAVDRVLARFFAETLDPSSLDRARTRLVADAIYAQDSQAMLARWYGASLAIGLTMDDVREWPARIEAVEAPAIVAIAKKHLNPRGAVTGFLLPSEETVAA